MEQGDVPGLIAEAFEVILRDVADLRQSPSRHRRIKPALLGVAGFPGKGRCEVACLVGAPVPKSGLGEKAVRFGRSVAVGSQGDDVGERAFAHALVSDDGYKVVVQLNRVVEPALA